MKTWVTEVGKSICSAPLLPPAMLPLSLKICAMSLSAVVTDGSVHGISWLDSWSYLSGPAVRR